MVRKSLTPQQVINKPWRLGYSSAGATFVAVLKKITIATSLFS